MPGCRRGGEEFFGRRILEDLPVGHEDNPVGGTAGEAHLVSYDQHGHTALGQRRHDFQDLGDHFGVKRGGRFIEQHDLGFHGECTGDGDSLLLSARKLSRQFVGLVGDTNPVQQLHGLDPGHGFGDSGFFARMTVISSVAWSSGERKSFTSISA